MGLIINIYPSDILKESSILHILERRLIKEFRFKLVIFKNKKSRNYLENDYTKNFNMWWWDNLRILLFHINYPLEYYIMVYYNYYSFKTIVANQIS